MRTRLLILALLLVAGGVAFAADGDALFRKRYSIEIGAGPAPFHTRTMGLSYSFKKELAKIGQEADMTHALYPAVSLSSVCRISPRWEIALTGGYSWIHHQVTQYETFGTDPYGQPRFDFNNGKTAGWMDSSAVVTLTLQGRYFWIPDKDFELYSAFGLGLTTASEFIPIPSLTPIAARYGGNHFYIFAETALNPIALYGHGGIGWRF